MSSDHAHPASQGDESGASTAEADDVRLAICAQGEIFGGVERQILDLCTYARQRTGAFPRLILFHDRELAKRARSLGLMPDLLRGRHRYDPALASQLAAILSENDIRVVHAHGYKAMVVCALARRRARWRVVKTEHGRPEPAAGRPLVWVKSRLNHRLDVWATRRAAATVCYVTEDIGRYYECAHRGLQRVVIHNGIAPLERSAFARPPELELGTLHLGIIGRVTAVKGIPTVLHALTHAELSQPWRLNIIGTGLQEAQLAAQARVLGIADRVRLLGFRENIFDYIAHLGALLMPSAHEGLPYVLLEAMSLGVPIIASRVGGLAEVLEHGRTGVLLPAGDVAAWRDAIRELAAEPTRARLLGEAAHNEQRQRYTLARMGQVYWEVFRGAMCAG